MSSLTTAPFPSTGLRLAPSTGSKNKSSSSSPPQAFHLRLSEHALADLIAASDKDPSSVSLVLGKNMCIKIGKSAFYSISAIEEPSLADVYSVTAGAPSEALPSAPLKYLGRVSHKLTVENHELDISSSKLKSQNEAALREKESMRTTLLEPKSHAPSQYSTPSPRLAPSSPHLTGLAKPRQTLAPSSPKPGNIMRSLPMRTLHLLAVEEPATAVRLADRTKSSVDDVHAILAQYAKTVINSTGKEIFELTDAAYKELHIWEWRGYYPSDRDKVIAKATAAFERLGLPKDDPAWKMLIEPRLRNAAPAEDPSSLQPSQADLIVPPLRLDDVPLPAPAPKEAPAAASSVGPAAMTAKGVGGAILKTKQVSKKPKPADDKEKEATKGEKYKKPTNVNNSPVPSSAAKKLLGSNKSTGLTTNKDTTLKVRKVKRPITPQLSSKPPSPAPSPVTANVPTAPTSTVKRVSKRTVETIDAPSESDTDTQLRKTSFLANSKEESAKKIKPDPTAASVEQSRPPRSASSTSPGTKSPRKPSPLGASPPITAADLEDEERERENRSRCQRGLEQQRNDVEAKEYEESELRRMAAMFKQSYEEYRRLYQDVRQYEISKEGGKKNFKSLNGAKKSSITNETTYQNKRERLLNLHHKLESWKSILWQAAPRFASV
ncbi:uncharacterized protein V1513DRAFT_416353 [Lipomyces chichibuensis]|uniref:uncharacterized protein n=1 Tax=Lipomyces chichibuensis TaxID=1546026 RepID=UPI0033438724